MRAHLSKVVTMLNKKKAVAPWAKNVSLSFGLTAIASLADATIQNEMNRSDLFDAAVKCIVYSNALNNLRKGNE